jgi:serine/threonine protein kinase
MGEVYLAKDNQLKRQVALKILKKTEHQDLHHRFRHEACAISALNHPNILSIYEFGQHQGLHFIITEFVKGKTLRQIISEGKLTLKDAIEIALQIGNTFVAAHEEGIIHRDIKPENIMIRPDGYVKVLDFGLAKLNKPEDIFSETQDQSTVSLFYQTEPGLIVGTICYMSPEQLRQQTADERTDLWSLGVVLFEMITGRLPFAGSVSEIIAAILERPVPLVSSILPEASPELDYIVSKALSKDKKDRYQSAKEFIEDLQAFKESRIDKLSFASAARQKKLSHQRRAAITAENPFPITTSQKPYKRWYGVSIIGLLFIILGSWFYLTQEKSSNLSVSKHVRTKSLPTSGSAINAVLSPDGRFIAYVRDDNGAQSLRLRQVNENADSELIPADFVDYSGIQFSNDSNNLFYTIFKGSPIGQLFKKPILGGTPQKIAEDVDSSVSFSPDGNQFAFIRSKSHEGVEQVIVSNIDGSNMRVLSERRQPDRYSMVFRESLAWSPDGKTIACAAGRQDDSGERMTVVGIDLANGNERELIPQKWFRVGKVLWTKDGQELVFTAADFGSELYQIWRFSVSNRQIEKITSELNDYRNISVSANSKILLAVADDRISNLYVAPSKSPNQTTQIAGGNLEGLGGLTWTPDGKIIYVSTESGNRDIWLMNADGQNHRQLTFDKSSDDSPSISADSRYIAFVSLRTGVPHIWRINVDGSNPIQLTNKGGEAFPQIMPDGSGVIYSGKPLKLWWKALAENGGEPQQLTEMPANWVTVSPNGSKFAGLTMKPGSPMQLSVFSFETGKLLNTFNLIDNVGTPDFPPMLRWSPNGRAIGYISTKDGISNIIIQPLQGNKPIKLTDFSADRIFAFDWSKDGKKIAYARGSARNKLLLFEDF